MTDLIRMLPLLKGWVYEGKVEGNITINAGGKWTAFDKYKKGWVWTAFASLSSNLAIVNLVYDDYVTVSASPYSLYYYGLTAPASNGMFCPKYSAGPPPLYTVVSFPVDPIPFNKHVVVTISNPTALPVVMYSYAHLLIIIEDEDAFRESIKKVLTQ